MVGSRSITIISTVCSTTLLISIMVLLPIMTVRIQRRNSLMLSMVEECQQESKAILIQLSRYQVQNRLQDGSAEGVREKRAYAPSAYRASRPVGYGNACCSCQQGKEGHPGPPGKDGRDGKSGAAGAPGRNGRDGRYIIPVTANEPPCQKCPTAPVGPPGLSGAKGNRGLPGPSGIPGTPGNPGRKGPPGPPGEPGAPGAIGVPGPIGDPGKVLNGAPPGPAGPPGQPGPRGRLGSPGSDGAPGAPGIEGPRGYMGTRGPPGNPGPLGPPGTPGTPGNRGPCNCDGKSAKAPTEYFKPAGSTAQPDYAETRNQQQVQPAEKSSEGYDNSAFPSPPTNSEYSSNSGRQPPSATAEPDYGKADLPPLKVYASKTFKKTGPIFKSRRNGYYYQRRQRA